MVTLILINIYIYMYVCTFLWFLLRAAFFHNASKRRSIRVNEGLQGYLRRWRVIIVWLKLRALHVVTSQVSSPLNKAKWNKIGEGFCNTDILQMCCLAKWQLGCHGGDVYSPNQSASYQIACPENWHGWTSPISLAHFCDFIPDRHHIALSLEPQIHANNLDFVFHGKIVNRITMLHVWPQTNICKYTLYCWSWPCSSNATAIEWHDFQKESAEQALNAIAVGQPMVINLFDHVLLLILSLPNAASQRSELAAVLRLAAVHVFLGGVAMRFLLGITNFEW